MRLAAIFALILCLAQSALAQNSEQDDKSFIENWLQENLSQAGRQVIVTDFRGALSSNATLGRLTIADENGVWFTLKDASLVWSRSALIRGRLEIDELTAGEILVERMPVTEGGVSPEDSQAWQFALPDLPVAVNIDEINAKRVVLKPPVLGEQAVLSLEGTFFLDGGVASAKTQILRTDRQDSLVFEGGFSNETRVLALDLDFAEAEDGLVSKLLRIPGAPSLRLQLAGEAPLSDYTAEIVLSSDSARRFGGTIEIAGLKNSEGAEVGHAFEANLSGDVRPLFEPEFHRFMGENATLTVAGQSLTDGRLSLDKLDMSSGAMDVSGRLQLAADGWPQSFDLSVDVAGQDVTRLPVAGSELTVRAANLLARFDADEGDTWQAKIEVSDLVRDDLLVGRAVLAGEGTITRAAPGAVTAKINFDAQSLIHSDPDLSRALGDFINGNALLSWTAQAPLQIGMLKLQTEDIVLEAVGSLDGLADGFPVTGSATLRSSNLSRYSGVAEQTLNGAAEIRVAGTGALLGGSFDVEVDANTTDLEISNARIDPLLKGNGVVSLAAMRDTNGTRLDRFLVRSDAVRATADGILSADRGHLNLAVDLSEVSLIEPKLTGPARGAAELNWIDNGALKLRNLTAEAVGATLAGSVSLNPDDADLPIDGEFTLISEDLSRLSAFTGRSMAGQLDWSLDGKGKLRSRSLDMTSELIARDFRSGIEELDRLVAGDITFDTSIVFDPKTLPHIRSLQLDTSQLDVVAKNDAPGEPINASARVADLGVLAPGFGGPATAQGQIVLKDARAKRVDVALDATGPGGTQAKITGSINQYAKQLALDLVGTAPLGLVNDFISPNSIDGLARFDLRLDGPAQLDALSGVVTVEQGRVALPNSGLTLQQLVGRVDLSQGQARPDVTGNAGTGGTFRVTGPIALQAPYPAALQIALNTLGVSDPTLYRTTVSGQITVDGPLSSGARIGGALSLGATEIMVPSGGSVTPGSVLDMRHINTPANVRRTQVRAGLTGEKTTGPGAVYPLDLTIRAINQIFVRGRGLDAELGGQLQLGGTTGDVTASGVFELIRGRLDILGRRLVLTEGLVDLRGALDPFLRFVAETQSDDFVVRVVLEGLASAPSVRFESEPDLPQEEAVARLLFGRGLDSISPFQAAQLVTAAATLSGQRSGGLSGSLRKSLGLSDLDVTTTEDGGNQLRAGAYINENIYSEVVVDSDGNREINLNLDINSNLTVRGGTSTEGNTGIGVFFEKDY